MSTHIHCSCGEVIVKSVADDTKVRAKIVLFKNDESFAVCKSCNAEVKIPLRLDTGMLKSLSSESRPVRLYIRDMKNKAESS